MKTETKFTVGEYKTRDGRDAIVCAIGRKGRLIGAVKDSQGFWNIGVWLPDGVFLWARHGVSDSNLRRRCEVPDDQA